MALNPYLEAIIAGIIWGSSGIFVKYLNLPPTTVTFFRLAIPTLILLLFFIFKKIKLFHGNNKLILLASTLNAGRVYLYTVGFTFASIGNAIIILYTWPIFTTIFSILFLKEKVPKRTFFLLFLALGGTALIYLNNEFSFSDKNFIGITAMLFSAVIYAFTVIIFKKELEKYSKYETIFYQNVIGSIIFIPFIFINKPLPTLFQTSIGIFYGALIGVVGFVFFFSALKKIKASTVSFLSYTEVVSAIILAVIFFQETLTWNIIVGGLLIILATTLTKKEN